MFALAPLDAPLAGSALLGRRPVGAGAGATAGSAAERSARLLDRQPARLEPAREPTPAVVAQISELARSLVGQALESGASYASFDLHLDLRQLGVAIDGRGARAFEGRALTVDLHVEASQGTFRTEHGDVSFRQLEVRFSIEELHVWGADTPATTPDGASRPARSLLDGLAEIARWLDESAAAGAERVDLDDLAMLAAERLDELKALLAQVGRAFQAMAVARSPSAAPSVESGVPTRGGARPLVDRIEGVAFGHRADVTIETLRFVRSELRAETAASAA